MALLRFANGALGVVEATTAARPADLEGSISILGENGTVEVGGFRHERHEDLAVRGPRPEDEGVLESTARTLPTCTASGTTSSSRRLRHDRVRRSAGPVDGREGRRSLEVITALYESIRRPGGEVRFPFTPRTPARARRTAAAR